MLDKGRRGLEASELTSALSLHLFIPDPRPQHCTEAQDLSCPFLLLSPIPIIQTTSRTGPRSPFPLSPLQCFSVLHSRSRPAPLPNCHWTPLDPHQGTCGRRASLSSPRSCSPCPFRVRRLSTHPPAPSFPTSPPPYLELSKTMSSELRSQLKCYLPLAKQPCLSHYPVL